MSRNELRLSDFYDYKSFYINTLCEFRLNRRRRSYGERQITLDCELELGSQDEFIVAAVFENAESVGIDGRSVG
jgi:hypothetical protein